MTVTTCSLWITFLTLHNRLQEHHTPTCTQCQTQNLLDYELDPYTSLGVPVWEGNHNNIVLWSSDPQGDSMRCSITSDLVSSF